MANPYTRLARQLEDVRGEVRALAGTPQLAYSSLENGSIDEYDQDGNLVQVIGRQWDGTHGAYPVSGPVPPVPTAPLLTGGLGLTIGWDGTFTNDAGVQDITVTAPMDWSRVELHASKVSGFTADTADTLVDSIESPRGGSRPALVEPGTWYAVLVSRSNTGKRSAQSAESSAVVTPPAGSDIDVDALREEFVEADAQLASRVNENRDAQTALEGTVTNLRNVTLPGLAADLNLARAGLDTVAGRVTPLESGLSLLQSDTLPALQAGINGKNSIFRTTAAPAAGDMSGAVGDRWEYWSTLNAGGKLRGTYRRQSTGWLQEVLDPTYLPQVNIGTGTVGELNGNRLTANSIKAGQVDSESVAAALGQFIKADIGNLTVTGTSKLSDVVAARVAANVGSFLTLTTDQLTAGTANLGDAVARKFAAETGAFMKLYANQVFIGHPGNLLPDPMFLDPGMIARRNEASTCTVYKSGANLGLNPGTATGSTYFRPLGVKQDTVNYKDWVSVKPGEVWAFEFATEAWKAASKASFVGRTLDGSGYKNPAESVAIAAGSNTYRVEATVPADCYWICPEITVPVGGISYIKAGSLKLMQKITPSLIIDGLMDAKRIVGASVESSAEARRGVKFNDAGLFGFDAAGNETLRLDGANSIITGATIRTAASGARWQMSASGLEAWNAAGERYLVGNANGLEMIGSLASKGKTAEATPRDITVRLTTVTRDILGQPSVANPALVFDTGGAVLGKVPGIYSADGKSISIIGGEDIWSRGQLHMSPNLIKMNATKIEIGDLGGFTYSTQTDITGSVINIGDKGNTLTNLDGTVRFDGKPHVPTYIGGAPDTALPRAMIGTGSALTSSAGVFTVTYDSAFSTRAAFILVTPLSGTAGYPVVNGGRLRNNNAEMVIPSAPNTSITYSYLVIGY